MDLFKKNSNIKKNIINNTNYPTHIKILEKNNFEDFIKGYRFTLIEFWAPWCIHCKTMKPRIRRLSVIYKGKIAFGKIDTTKNKNILKNYNIMSIPQIIIFKNGKKISNIMGLKSIGELKNFIDNILKK
jgi:thioredoxin 1